MSGEVDFVTPNHLEEVQMHIQLEQIDDRKRIATLEDKIDQLEQTIQAIQKTNLNPVVGEGIKESNENRALRLYEALKTAPKNCMKSKEVMGLLGLQYHQQAYRVMKIAKESYEGVKIRKTSKNKTIVVLEAF